MQSSVLALLGVTAMALLGVTAMARVRQGVRIRESIKSPKMDSDTIAKLASGFVSAQYVAQGRASLTARRNALKSLLAQRRIPEEPWDAESIEWLVRELVLMDSNHFSGAAGLGEREGRVFSSLVQHRHSGLSHGMGRSGNIAAEQPKAAGSSLLVKLTQALALDMLRFAGVPGTRSAVALPLATGMALFFSLEALKSAEDLQGRTRVVIPRMDQKSALKAVSLAGLEPIVVENRVSEDGTHLETDVEAVERVLRQEPSTVLCVLSTTSCFAPRSFDRIVDLARLCKTYSVGHVVNNAYGVQSVRCMRLIEQGGRQGRVDAFVQSTDKNFGVPVGGSVIGSFEKAFVDRLARLYPGRASSSPLVDLFITFLQLGRPGFQRLWESRATAFDHLVAKLQMVANKHGEQVLQSADNDISVAITLDRVDNPKEIGSALFLRNVSGTRVVVPDDPQIVKVGGVQFQGYGSHGRIPHVYLTAAAAIGVRLEEIDVFVEKLDKLLATKKRG